MKKFLIAVMILLTVAGVAHAEQKKSAWSPELRIGLASGVDKVTLKVSAPCILLDAKSGKRIDKIPAGKDFVVDCAKLKVDAVEIRPKEIPPRRQATSTPMIREEKNFPEVDVEFTPSTIVNGFILSELLDKPKALRRRGRRL